MENTKKVEILTEIKNYLELHGSDFTCNICRSIYNKEDSPNHSDEYIWYRLEIRRLPINHRKLFLELWIEKVNIKNFEDLSEYIFAGHFQAGIPFELKELNMRLKMLDYLIKYYSNEKTNS